MRQYLPGDIGWDFWCKEGDAFPPRTIELLKNVDAAMFGAITSKPAKTAAAELAPALQNKGLTYRSPIVRMRQLFDLYICLRPCKGYPGNPLNFKEGIDLVVYRENTEDLYAGVEFAPVPQELADTLAKLAKPFAPFAKLPLDQYAVSCKINTRAGSERIVRAAFEFARQHRRKKVTIVHKANVVRATDGLFLEAAKAVAKDFPEIKMDDANIDAMTMWLLKNPFNYDVLVAPNLYGDIISDLCAQMVGRAGLRLLGQYRQEAGCIRADAWLGAQIRRPIQGEPDRHDPGREDDAGLAGRIEEGRRPGGRGGPGHQGRQSPHLRYGRVEHDPANGAGDSGEAMTALAPGQEGRKVILHEVGLRDGLQMEKQVVPLEQKIRWTESPAGRRGGHHPARLVCASGQGAANGGHRCAVPAFLGAGARPSGAVLSGLVLNEKGLERGMACGVEMFCMGVSASETHSQKNTGMSSRGRHHAHYCDGQIGDRRGETRAVVGPVRIRLRL